MPRRRKSPARRSKLSPPCRALKSRKVLQLGSLVEATGADMLDIETLAGGLLAMVELNDTARTEKLRERGAAFFQPRTRESAGTARGGKAGLQANDGGAAPARSESGAT